MAKMPTYNIKNNQIYNFFFIMKLSLIGYTIDYRDILFYNK